MNTIDGMRLKKNILYTIIKAEIYTQHEIVKYAHKMQNKLNILEYLAIKIR